MKTDPRWTWSDRLVQAARAGYVITIGAGAVFAVWWVVRCIYLSRQIPREQDAIGHHVVVLVLAAIIFFSLFGVTRTMSHSPVTRDPWPVERERIESFYSSREHTFIIAVMMRDNTGTHDRGDAEAALVALMPRPAAVDDHRISLEGWWVAEDDRLDPSDNDSAIFVPKGMQAHVEQILASKGFDRWAHDRA